MTESLKLRIGLRLYWYSLKMSKPTLEEDLASFSSHSKQMEIYLTDLMQLIIDSGGVLEGNSFYQDSTLNIYPELFTKQVNIFCCGKLPGTKMCEIGFNAGHSCMLMLLGRDKTPLDFTVFDIGHHAYTKPCLEYIKSQFSHVKFEYVEGDSTVTMPEWIQQNSNTNGSYDLIHVDGGHTEHCISNDMKNADILIKVGGILIVDDVSLTHVNDCVNSYLASGKYIEINVLTSYGYPHRIIRKKQ